jgi:hypothetical protein
MITAEVERPTIGIGAGPDCDGQVLVFHDLVNLTFGHAAKFVRRYGDAAALITQSVLAFKADVVSHQFPNDARATTCRKKRRPHSKRYSTASTPCSDNGGWRNVVRITVRTGILRRALETERL